MHSWKSIHGGRSLSAIAVATALTLTACSSSKSTGSAAATNSTGSTTTGSTGTPSVARGSSKIPVKTIGVWQSQADGEGEEATLAAIKAADAAVGWKTVVTDSNGNIQAMQSTMQSLIGQHVDAILTVFVATGLIAPQLAAAKAAGIPVISVGYQGTPSSDITAEYAPDQTAEAKLLLARMGQDLPKGGKVGPIAVQGYFGIDAVLKVLHDSAAQYNFTVLNTINAPTSDVFNGETQAALSFLNGNSDLAAIYGALDIGVQTIMPAETQLGRKVPIYGFGAIQSALKFVRTGIATVVTSDGTAKAGFIAVDSLLGYWINKTPIPATVPADDALQYKIVDKTNAPAAGTAVYPLPDIAKTFLSKWATEYGISR